MHEQDVSVERGKVIGPSKVKALKGIVVSDAMNKSRTLKIERLVKHREYEKYVRRTTKIIFHDEDNRSHIGDKVLIQACRPRSKRKSFELLQIVEETKR